MINKIEYKVLTQEEAIWYALRNNSSYSNVIGTIKNLRKGDRLTLSYPISISVDPEVAQQILKEYINETVS